MPRFAIDAVDAPQTALPAVIRAIGRKPEAYMAYLTGPGRVTAAGVAYLRDQGLALGAVYSGVWGTSGMAGGYPRGHADAMEAETIARLLGFPAGVVVFLDVETNWCADADKLVGPGASADYLQGWADGIGSTAYRPGVYGNPLDPSFVGALGTARTRSAAAASMPLWTSEGEPGGAPAIPAWAPRTIPGVSTAAWQWQENWQPVAGVSVDLDLVADAFDGLWEAHVAGFADVTTGQWDARDIADVVSLGLMQGTSPTTFAPNAPLTRGQEAAILARQARKLGWLPQPSAAVLPSPQRRPYGAIRGKPGRALPHHADAIGAVDNTPGYVLLPGLPGMPSLNQGGLPTCVENACAWAHYWQQRHDGLPTPTLGSRMWLWAMAGGPTGTVPTTALGIMEQDGLCPESLDPYPDLQATWAPNASTTLWTTASHGLTAAMAAAAAPYRITGRARVNIDPGDICAALRQPRPVLLTLSVTQSFEGPNYVTPAQALPADLASAMSDPSMIAAVPDPWLPAQSLGAHEVAIIGVLPSDPYLPALSVYRRVPYYYILRNEWGARWGTDDFVLLPCDWAGLEEAYVITGLQASLQHAPSPLCPIYSQQLQAMQQFLAGPMVANRTAIIERAVQGGRTPEQAAAFYQAQVADLQRAISALQTKMTTLGCGA